MYVKVTAGLGIAGDFLLRVRSDEIHSGTAIIPWSSEGDNDPAGRLWDELGMGGDWWRLAHVLEIDTDQFVVAQADDLECSSDEDVPLLPEKLIVKYAWWWHEDGGAECVVTTRNIFVMGEGGQTIDRVR